MKTHLIVFYLFLYSGIFAQNQTNSLLNSYQRKTLNTELFSRPVNTGSNHTLLILGSAWDMSPEIGDEIAVYDSNGNTVASVAWRPEQEGHSALAVWGDDELTPEKEGMVNGEFFNIVLFDKSEDDIITLKINSFDRGTNSFSKNGLTVVNSISRDHLILQELQLFQNVPNPVVNFSSIGFYLPEDGNVKLSISNSLGQEIFTITNQWFDKGTYNINFDANDMSNGIYFYSLVANSKLLTKQFTIIK